MVSEWEKGTKVLSVNQPGGVDMADCSLENKEERGQAWLREVETSLWLWDQQGQDVRDTGWRGRAGRPHAPPTLPVPLPCLPTASLRPLPSLLLLHLAR